MYDMHIELTSSTRRAVRRSVGLRCDVLSPASGLQEERILDLSPRGACITSKATLAPEHGLLLAFCPPGASDSVEAVARVARVLPSPDGDDERVLGLEFTYLPTAAQRQLERAIAGLPPPLPARPTLEVSWLDVEMSWEEELDDRVNVFTASERLLCVDDGESLIEVAAPAAAVRLPVHLRAC